MSQLSLIAQTLADYAKSEAKRASNEEAGFVHLLAAIRRWQEEAFDQRYPGLAERVRHHLSRNKGAATKSPALLAEVTEKLTSVSSADDAWDIADALSKDLDPILEAAPQVNETPDSVNGNSNVIGPSVTDPLPFSITEGLLEQASEVTGMAHDAIASMILTAAHAVAVEVLGADQEGLFNELCEAAGLDIAERSSAEEAGHIVATIASFPRPDAGRAATRVALSLVEVAEWAAARDENVTKEETDRIDKIRLRFREQLGAKLDAESESMSAFEAKFAQLVGMESVKTEIRKRVDYLVVNKRREKRGGPASSHRMHMAFVGNPGTGKTTVARLYGELLHELGLLPKDNFVETDRSGLVGAYVGHTDQKTREVVDQADGGVLFIDEAYALDDGYREQKGFGEEATNVLVKQMEDRKDRMVVILAGYKDETLAFMNLNPGLKSRVPVVIDFPDYSDEELIRIADGIAERQGLVIDEGAREGLIAILRNAREASGFGNARTVENVLEAAQRNAVNRNAALGNLATEAEMRTILQDDLPEVAPQKKKVIGFGPSTYI